MAKSITLDQTSALGTIIQYTVLQTGVSNTLSGSSGSATTTITLNDSSSFSASGIIRINEEIISYTGNSGNQLTGCTRGFENSNSASSLDGTTVYQVTTSFGTNKAGITDIDYFADNADIGSCLYLAQNVFYQPGFTGAIFNVGTAITATSITLKQEVKDRRTNTWVQIPHVTDETQGFTVLGSKKLKTQSPYWWMPANVNNIKSSGFDFIWMRIRISDVVGLSEGGANSSVSVKLIGDRFIISGGTAQDPVTMTDIYNASVSGNWEAITCFSTNDYLAAGKIFFLWGFYIYLSGGCVFKSTNEIILGLPGFFTGDNNANNIAQFGEPYWTNMLGIRGSVVMMSAWGYSYNVYWSGAYQFKYYNSCLLLVAGQTANYSCNFEFVSSIVGQFSDYYGSMVFYGGNKNYFYNSSLLMQANSYLAPNGYDWTFSNSTFGSLSAYQDSVGIIARDTKIDTAWCMNGTKVVLFDCIYSTLGMGMYYESSTNAYIYVHYSLNLSITNESGIPISGAIINITDKDGNIPVKWVGGTTGSIQNVENLTTDINGNITTDLLHYIHWREKISPYILHEYTYSPFNININKPGFKTKTVKYTMNTKRIEIETLELSDISIDQEGAL